MNGSRDSLDPEFFRTDGHLPEAVYFYRDAENHPVGASARFAPGTLDPDRKSFRLFRSESGGWNPGLNGSQLPLYNLPEVIAAVGRGETVFIPEGEKCADLLSAWGLPSTTNACGAGKWNDSDAAHFKDADVVLLSDADQPGRRHVEAVARSLHGRARSVRILELPGLGEGEDVVDWHRAGGTPEVLAQLVEVAPHWTPPASTADSEAWEEPLPFGVSSESAPFPLEKGLPTLLHDLSLAAAETIKVDPAAPAGLASVVLSAAAGNAYQVRVSRAHVEPNLARYLIWSCPSGERKSALFRCVVSPFDIWMREEQKGYQEKLKKALAEAAFHRKVAEVAERKGANAKSEDEAKEFLEKAEAARSKIPRFPRRPIAYIGDTTQEALVRHTDENKGASAVLSGDARQVIDAVLGQHRKDGSTDESVYLRAHAGDRLDRARIGNTPGGEYVAIDRPSLALGLCVQPDKLADLAGRKELGDSGFIARCNTIQPRSLVGERIESGSEPPFDPEIAREWTLAVKEIITQRFSIVDPKDPEPWSPVQLKLDPEATERRRAFANEIETRQRSDGDLKGAGGLASKCAGEAARLAGLYHLLELALEGNLREAGVIPIPVRVWNYAEHCQRWHLAESLRVLSLSLESVEAKQGRRVLEWAAREPAKRRVLTPRDLVGARIVEIAKEAEQVFAWLAERRWVRPVEAERGQRARRWEVHAKAFAGGLQ